MTYHSLEEVITDPIFARADLALRRGRHVGPDYDAGLFDFLTSARNFLDDFYGRYNTALLQGGEGYYYLLPDRLAVPPPLGLRRLTPMDMLTGQTLALMRLDHKWLETNYRIPELTVFELMEQLLGDERLLSLISRRRGKDASQDARKLRELFVSALHTLETLGFIRREGRAQLGLVIPLLAIMRFADPVRGDEELQVALRRLIAEGQMKDDGEAADAEHDS